MTDEQDLQIRRGISKQEDSEYEDWDAEPDLSDCGIVRGRKGKPDGIIRDIYLGYRVLDVHKELLWRYNDYFVCID